MREHKKFERFMLFYEVANQLSFTKAAESLQISRGYLSDQIKRLEQEVGAPLLIRSTRNIKLTKSGMRTLEDMRGIKESLLALERNIQQERTALEGLIRITAPELFTQRFLSNVCQQFHELHPHIQFSIDTSYTSADLMRSHYDLAIRSTHSPPDNMVAKVLYSYRHTCCASPDYLEKYGYPESVEALKAHQCLRSPNIPGWSFKNNKLEVQGWVELNDNQVLKQQALSGRGIVRLPEYFTDREVAAGNLINVLEHEYTDDEHKIYIIHPQLSYQSVRVKAFIDFTQQWFLTKE